MSDLAQIEQRVATLERELAELNTRPPMKSANLGDVSELG